MSLSPSLIHIKAENSPGHHTELCAAVMRSEPAASFPLGQCVRGGCGDLGR